MRYYLWISEKQTGPYNLDAIRWLLHENKITGITLATLEGGNGEWIPVNTIEEITDLPTPTVPTVNKVNEPVFKLPVIEESVVANVLVGFALLDIIGAMFGGFLIGNGNNASEGNPLFGVCFAVGGILGGLILLGFARVVENTNQTSQRLNRIEMIIQKSIDDRNK